MWEAGLNPVWTGREVGDRVSEMGPGLQLIRLGSKWLSAPGGNPNGARVAGSLGKVNLLGVLDSEMQTVAYSIPKSDVTLIMNGIITVDFYICHQWRAAPNTCIFTSSVISFILIYPIDDSQIYISIQNPAPVLFI